MTVGCQSRADSMSALPSLPSRRFIVILGRYLRAARIPWTAAGSQLVSDGPRARSCPVEDATRHRRACSVASAGASADPRPARARALRRARRYAGPRAPRRRVGAAPAAAPGEVPLGGRLGVRVPGAHVRCAPTGRVRSRGSTGGEARSGGWDPFSFKTRPSAAGRVGRRGNVISCGYLLRTHRFSYAPTRARAGGL
jgi:hypothetical protein